MGTGWSYAKDAKSYAKSHLGLEVATCRAGWLVCVVVVLCMSGFGVSFQCVVGFLLLFN